MCFLKHFEAIRVQFVIKGNLVSLIFGICCLFFQRIKKSKNASCVKKVSGCFLNYEIQFFEDFRYSDGILGIVQQSYGGGCGSTHPVLVGGDPKPPTRGAVL